MSRNGDDANDLYTTRPNSTGMKKEPKHLFYTELAEDYDRIYSYIDYKRWTEFYIKLIDTYCNTGGKMLLDVACGTGLHAHYLQKAGFLVTGLDLNQEMLEQAKKRNNCILYQQGDMNTFDLKKTYDIVTCCFNSIIYNKNQTDLKKTLKNLYKHTKKGGILIFDMVDKKIGIDTERTEYHNKENRMTFGGRWNLTDHHLILELDFLIDGKKTEETHTMGAFTIPEVKIITQDIGFSTLVLDKDLDSITKFSETRPSAIFLCRKD